MNFKKNKQVKVVLVGLMLFLASANFVKALSNDRFAPSVSKRAIFNSLQLYPDVEENNEFAADVNLGTALGVVQGFYEDADSPFKPDQVITRIQAIKVLLGAGDLIKWMYRDELAATLGGEEGVKAQKTVFTDVDLTNDSFMWWYPRYLAVACDSNIIECKKGTNFRPDDFVTAPEINLMVLNMKKYLSQDVRHKNLNEDTDKDGLKNYLEQFVYFTDISKKDTDADGLTDYEELITYKTSPFLKDTDNDGLDDFSEVKKYKTNPRLSDSDNDGFSDLAEINAKTNPINAKNFPADKNLNGIGDDWENKFGLNIVDGTQDTDNDGLSDKLEYEYNTDPIKPDTDKDGYSDSDEIFVYGSNPLDFATPGKHIRNNIRITGLIENQIINDSKPVFQGITNENSKIRIVLRNDFGNEKVLGDTMSDESGNFIFETLKEIKDGQYQLIARLIDESKKLVKNSLPVHFTIDTKIKVVPPLPQKLGERDLTDEILVKNLRVEVENSKPVLKGETEFGSKVVASWRSALYGSAIIADLPGGKFKISSPINLGVGNHEVYVSAIRSKDGAQSKTIKVSFLVGTPTSFNSGDLIDAVSKLPEGSGAFDFGKYIVDFNKENGLLFWLTVILLLGFLISALAYQYLKISKEVDR